MPFSKGTVIRGRYEVKDPLGRGGGGTTHLAWDQQAHRYVVLKFPLPQAPMHNALREEIETLRGLEHQHLPKFYDAFDYEDRPCLVMEYIPGKDLMDFIEDVPDRDVFRIIQWMRELLETLAFLHERRIVHRDVKPENIRIHGQTEQVYLLDFGIAKNRTLTLMRGSGTPPYSPPEQLEPEQLEPEQLEPEQLEPEQRSQKSTPASDVYATGATFYLLTTGKDPVDSITRQRSAKRSLPNNTAIPSQLKPIIRKAMNLEPKKRYLDAGEMLKALNKAEEQMKDQQSAKACQEAKKQIEQKNESLSQELDRINQQLDVQKQQCISLLKTNAQLENEKRRLQEQLDAIQSDKEQLENQLQADLDATHDAKERLQTECDQLQQDQERLQTECNQLRTDLDTIQTNPLVALLHSALFWDFFIIVLVPGTLIILLLPVSFSEFVHCTGLLWGGYPLVAMLVLQMVRLYNIHPENRHWNWSNFILWTLIGSAYGIIINVLSFAIASLLASYSPETSITIALGFMVFLAIIVLAISIMSALTNTYTTITHHPSSESSGSE
jgi:serine/threonine protein kinase